MDKKYPEEIQKDLVIAHHQKHPKAIYIGQCAAAIRGYARHDAWHHEITTANDPTDPKSKERPKLRVTFVDGVPVSNPMETLLELSKEGDTVYSLVITIGSVIRAKHMTLKEIKRQLAWYKGRQGIQKLKRAVKYASDRDESVFESHARLYLLQLRFPTFEQQVDLLGADGKYYRADFFRKRYHKGLIIEVDGHEKHRVNAKALADEQERYQALIKAGYDMVRVTYPEFWDGELGRRLERKGIMRKSLKRFSVNRNR
jgi:very-short-patch-repair endonuclease